MKGRFAKWVARWGAVARRRWPLSCAVLAALSLIGFGAWRLTLSHQKPDEDAFRLRLTVPSSGDAFAVALYQSLGARVAGGHDVQLLLNGKVFDALVERIAGAKSSIHLGMYIWAKGAASDRVVGALLERARAGVACRILVDDVGSPDFIEDIAPILRSAGCKVRVFRPVTGDNKLARSHRKLVIVDGHAAITGGFGIRDTWLGDGVHAEAWRDTNIAFEGPAVSDAQQAFAENWQEAGGELLPGSAFPKLPSDHAGPAADGGVRAAFVASSQGVVTRAERLTQLLISAATKRLWIANAYFVPSSGILELIKQKARAGVDVRILAPYKNSDSKTAFGAQHTEYGSLAELGVKIWEYTPSMMHAKTMLVDDALALVGSINLDPLSLNELEEDALVLDDVAFSRELGQAFTADCAHAKRYEK